MSSNFDLDPEDLEALPKVVTLKPEQTFDTPDSTQAQTNGQGKDARGMPVSNQSRMDAKRKTVRRARGSSSAQISEENWNGICRGGCGKRISGEYVCANCRKTAADKNFALKPGEIELYRGNEGDPADKVIKQVVITDAASVEPGEMAWIWPNVFPDGAITWCMGQPNNGKSLLTIEIAACVTTGRDWPDGGKNTLGARKVLMYCGEDSLGKVVVPRLMAAGANLSPGMIGFLDRKSFRTVAGDNDPEKRPLDLSRDLETLLELLKAKRDYKVVIVDPITGVFGGKDMGRNVEIDPVLRDLIDFCEQADVAFLGITHTPKLMTNSAIDKIPGGSAMRGSAKSAFMLSRDPDSDDKHDHMLTMVKWNYTAKATGLKFRTVEADVVHKGVALKAAKILWGEATELIGDDVLVAQNAKKETGDRQKDRCDAFLQTYLANGPVRSPDVYAAALAHAGRFSDDTVRKSLKRIGGDHVDRRNQHEGYWMTLTPNAPWCGGTVVSQQVVAGKELMGDVDVL